jgi:hypothetical protein
MDSKFRELTNVDVPEPLVGVDFLALPQHTKTQVLASRVYLVACYREHELQPFSFMIHWGHIIGGQGDYFPDYYKFYLLPKYVSHE